MDSQLSRLLVDAVPAEAVLLVSWVCFLSAAILQRRAPRVGDFLAYDRVSVAASSLVVFGIVGLIVFAVLVDLPFGVGLASLGAIWALYWLPSAHRLVRSSATHEIAASVTTVMNLLRDVRRQPEWMRVLRVDAPRDGALDQGDRYRQVVEISGHEVAVDCVVLLHERDARIVLAVRGREQVLADTFTMTPRPGGTLVLSEGTIRMPLPVALLAGWRRTAFVRDFSAMRSDSLQRLTLLAITPTSNEVGP